MNNPTLQRPTGQPAFQSSPQKLTGWPSVQISFSLLALWMLSVLLLLVMPTLPLCFENENAPLPDFANAEYPLLPGLTDVMPALSPGIEYDAITQPSGFKDDMITPPIGFRDNVFALLSGFEDPCLNSCPGLGEYPVLCLI